MRGFDRGSSAFAKRNTSNAAYGVGAGGNNNRARSGFSLTGGGADPALGKEGESDYSCVVVAAVLSLPAWLSPARI